MTNETNKAYTLKDIPNELWRKVKVRCAMDEISIRDLIINYLTEITKDIR